MIEINDILNLIGRELKDGSEQSKRFREFIEQDKWTTDQIKKWLDECIINSSGAHDPYNRAFQDLIISMGIRLGFSIEYGRYAGRAGEDNFDGIWKRSNGDALVLEAKTSTWPIGSVGQLGDYVDKLSIKESDKNIFGLYVIGKGDVQPLTEQILGSKFKEKMRLIIYEDLIRIVSLKEQLEPAVGKEEAIIKFQNILLPIESINIGNIINLILEIATSKPPELDQSELEGAIEDTNTEESPWTKNELIPYIEGATPYQRLLLAALVQSDKEPATMKIVIFLMNEIARRRPKEGIDKKITGRQIAGARGGLKMRRKPLEKEDILESSWDPKEDGYMYKIKDNYKQVVLDWVKSEELWIKDDIG